LGPRGDRNIRWLRDFLRALAAEGRTVLISSHLLSEVAQTVDDVIVIHHGRLIGEGPVERPADPRRVSVRSPRLTDLAAVIERAGGQVSRDEDDVLLVSGLDAAQVGDLASGAMLGVAISVLVANQVAAVVGTLVFLFVAQPLIAAASSTVGKFLFGNALTAVGGRGIAHELAFGAAVAVSLAWTALALALAGWVDDRRDIA
jgi:hypothetical protein